VSVWPIRVCLQPSDWEPTEDHSTPGVILVSSIASVVSAFPSSPLLFAFSLRKIVDSGRISSPQHFSSKQPFFGDERPASFGGEVWGGGIGRSELYFEVYRPLLSTLKGHRHPCSGPEGLVYFTWSRPSEPHRRPPGPSCLRRTRRSPTARTRTTTASWPRRRHGTAPPSPFLPVVRTPPPCRGEGKG